MCVHGIFMHVQVHMHVSMWRHKDNFSYYSSDTVHFRFFFILVCTQFLGLARQALHKPNYHPGPEAYIF